MENSLIKINDYCFEIPKQGKMRVPARIFGSKQLIDQLEPKVFEQVANVATLPGIVRASFAMPDAHWGYGFPIGGVAAFDPNKGGIICVGGIGYDISCGVRSLVANLYKEEVKSKLEKISALLFKRIPSGIGSEGLIKLSESKLDELLLKGAHWAVERGYGTVEDLEYIEDNGKVPGACPDKVSSTAKKRQKRQIGTLGSGNHYLEIQYVSKIYDEHTARVFGLKKNQVVITIHCGSRALGHQIGTDYIHILAKAAKKYNIYLPERELVCAPILSKEGQDFYGAMVCGINCALANRQVLTHLIRECFEEIFPGSNLSLLYDVSHNTCKIETHEVDGKRLKLYVHRKGATRAYPPGSPEIPLKYQEVGQPVIIGGTMGTSSYILAGNYGQNPAFYSACHGAGRSMSRRQATKRWKGKDIIKDLASKGIIIMAASKKGAAEEAPLAYKDVDEVVLATHEAGLARRVVKLKPLACIKG
jgi:tRNA-splicing ligase RtcB